MQSRYNFECDDLQVCYFWRLVNPQLMTQMQLLAVLYGKEADLLQAIPLLGFLPPAMVGVASYIHLQYASQIVWSAAEVGI